jgi:4-amino-4-deoxy-L-arabinose transferase-like glycosyltransferase
VVRIDGWLTCLAVVTLAAAIYFHSFGTVPYYLGGDEANLAIQAHSLATTGRDLSGRFLPLFVNVEDPLPEFQGNRWWQPLLVYFDAVLLTVLPFSEWTVRLPLVLLALANVVLMFAVARQWFPAAGYPALSALMLVLTPAHLIFARQAADYFAPLTFSLLWLWCLTRFLATGGRRWALATGFALGAGTYSHISAWAFMPMFFVLTIATVVHARRATWRSLASIAIAFVLPIALFVPWLMREPQMVNELIGSYGVMERNLTPLQSLRDKLNYNNIQDKVAIYWNHFNPSFLFLTGGVHPAQATREVGVFLLPVAVFLAVGLYALIGTLPTSSASVLLIGGFLLAPIPATLRGEGAAISRMLVILPFALLIAVHGVAVMLRSARLAVRGAAIVLLALMPLQYGAFLRDYFGDYQVRSAHRYDSMNFRDVARHMIERDAVQAVPAFYLSSNADDPGARWRFYLVKHKREDLWPRSFGFDPGRPDLSRVPAGSLVVIYKADPAIGTLVDSGRCVVDGEIPHIGGSPSTVVLRC